MWGYGRLCYLRWAVFAVAVAAAAANEANGAIAAAAPQPQITVKRKNLIMQNTCNAVRSNCMPQLT